MVATTPRPPPASSGLGPEAPLADGPKSEKKMAEEEGEEEEYEDVEAGEEGE